MPALHENFRMDFQVQLLGDDPSTGRVYFTLRPDPARYEWIEHDGERALFDRLDRYIIPEHVLAKAAANMADIPMTFAPPLIDDALDYVASRVPSIEARLAGEYPAGAMKDLSGDLLAELAGHDHHFAIVSIDLVGSTRMATTIARSHYVRIVQTLVGELAEIVPLFHGHVLKYTGDGLIAFIPFPSRNQQNDLAIDCALTMRALVYSALNPALVRAGLSRVDVRLGIDAGEASVVVLGSPATKRHADIIGDVVSLACKVESAGRAGDIQSDIQIGGVAARAMHTHWRELLEVAPMPARWPYEDGEGSPYPVYRACVAPRRPFSLGRRHRVGHRYARLVCPPAAKRRIGAAAWTAASTRHDDTTRQLGHRRHWRAIRLACWHRSRRPARAGGGVAPRRARRRARTGRGER